jgi:hypothetical protein
MQTYETSISEPTHLKILKKKTKSINFFCTFTSRFKRRSAVAALDFAAARRSITENERNVKTKEKKNRFFSFVFFFFVSGHFHFNCVLVIAKGA